MKSRKETNEDSLKEKRTKKKEVKPKMKKLNLVKRIKEIREED